jgi:hypothetical protein
MKEGPIARGMMWCFPGTITGACGSLRHWINKQWMPMFFDTFHWAEVLVSSRLPPPSPS